MRKKLFVFTLLMCFIGITNVNASTKEERKTANNTYLTNYTFNFKINRLSEHLNILKPDGLDATMFKHSLLGNLIRADITKHITLGANDATQIMCYQNGDTDTVYNESLHRSEEVTYDHDWCNVYVFYSDGEIDEENGGIIGLDVIYETNGTFEIVNGEEALSKKAMDTVKDLTGSIRVADMDMINHLLNYESDGGTFFEADNAIKEFPKLKAAKEANPEFDFVPAFEPTGRGDAYGTVAEGAIMLKKDDIVYGLLYNSYHADFMFFVPAGTARDNYASVLKQRIKGYIKDDSVSVDVRAYNTSEYADYSYDIEKLFGITSAEYYNLVGTTFDEQAALLNAEDRTYLRAGKCITMQSYYLDFNGHTYKIGIAEIDNEHLKQFGNVSSKDLDTGIIIKSGSSNVPLDATLSVEKYNLTKEETALLGSLGYKEVSSFDLNLYSSILNKVISNFNNESEILIPLGNINPDDLQMVYISDDLKTTEKFDVTVVTCEGIKYLVFETNHFSNYILVSKAAVNPETLDSINTYVIMALVSAVFVGLSTYKIKHIN